ncbi:hypothetical protein BLNAU_5777 [Blattamonas nauphoetae]|uniref:Uncharacterized protein n=1 Tax=Blattamonas nauphoetae TaxID=2049346 RepID=A0ABQ9Y697_9EUKA|nr:hypothetical protein BLNAU_5777 [Blattamonas nauphoetae]
MDELLGTISSLQRNYLELVKEHNSRQETLDGLNHELTQITDQQHTFSAKIPLVQTEFSKTRMEHDRLNLDLMMYENLETALTEEKNELETILNNTNREINRQFDEFMHELASFTVLCSDAFASSSSDPTNTLNELERQVLTEWARVEKCESALMEREDLMACVVSNTMLTVQVEGHEIEMEELRMSEIELESQSTALDRHFRPVREAAANLHSLTEHNRQLERRVAQLEETIVAVSTDCQLMESELTQMTKQLNSFMGPTNAEVIITNKGGIKRDWDGGWEEEDLKVMHVEDVSDWESD